MQIITWTYYQIAKRVHTTVGNFTIGCNDTKLSQCMAKLLQQKQTFASDFVIISIEYEPLKLRHPEHPGSSMNHEATGG